MMALQMKEIFRFEAVGVGRFVAGELHEVLFQRRRFTAAAARLVIGAVVDVVVVVVAVIDKRGRRGAVLLVDELELLVQVEQLLSAEAALAD